MVAIGHKPKSAHKSVEVWNTSNVSNQRHTSVEFKVLASRTMYPVPGAWLAWSGVIVFEQSKLFSMAITARGEGRIFGSWLEMLQCGLGLNNRWNREAKRTYRTVKLSKGESAHVHITLFCVFATVQMHASNIAAKTAAVNPRNSQRSLDSRLTPPQWRSSRYNNWQIGSSNS